MYIPKDFENNNIEQQHTLIENYSFATLISHTEQDPLISHLPVMLARSKGTHGTLIWHMAKLNPQAKEFNGLKTALCIFHGPHAYISPTWYKNHPSVPTWNYAVVHAHGVPQLISESELSDHLTNMVDRYESSIREEKKYVLSDEYKLKLLKHISGFRMEITKIESKFKLGQNRDLADQNSMLDGLLKQDDSESQALANFIKVVTA